MQQRKQNLVHIMHITVHTPDGVEKTTIIWLNAAQDNHFRLQRKSILSMILKKKLVHAGSAHRMQRPASSVFSLSHVRQVCVCLCVRACVCVRSRLCGTNDLPSSEWEWSISHRYVREYISVIYINAFQTIYMIYIYIYIYICTLQ